MRSFGGVALAAVAMMQLLSPIDGVGAHLNPLKNHLDHRRHEVLVRGHGDEYNVEKRSTDTGTTYLPNIIALVTTSCQTICSSFTSGITGCLSASNATDLQIATCSCSSPILADISNCVNCIANDPSSTSGSQSQLQYNGFTEQCISVGLAGTSALISVAPQKPSTTTATSASSATPSTVIVTETSTEAGQSTSAVATASPTAKSAAGHLRPSILASITAAVVVGMYFW